MMVHPKLAYILRWFPEPSETFIYHEVTRLQEMDVPLKVFMTYGKVKKDLSPEMARASQQVEKQGIPFLLRAPGAVTYWRKRNHTEVFRLFRTIPFRRWCDIETAGENLWAFLCGFHLARRFAEEGIEHIHAPWANGPATAAWVASQLTGIPFSFTAHAGDIFPPDGALAEKIEACCFLRTENAANIAHLHRYSGRHAHKIHVIHNGIPTDRPAHAPVMMKPPYRILALGRHVPKKGFDTLLRSCAILKERGIDFHLAMGGSGPCERDLKKLSNILGLGLRVSFPGFIPHHLVPEFLCSGDIFVMPSLIDASGDRDGVPTVIMEALFHGLPVVASDVSGIGEIIQDGNTGVLIPQKDPLALASALDKMIGDREAALSMAGRGRSAVLERFDVGKSCREILHLFNAHKKHPQISFSCKKRG
jgi:colanic acid/amylovoran biosynthesis glycosyltransferase